MAMHFRYHLEDPNGVPLVVARRGWLCGGWLCVGKDAVQDNSPGHFNGGG